VVCGRSLTVIVGSNPTGGMAVSSVSVVCCQVAVCASGRSLFQRSPTDCCAPVCDREASIMSRPWPTGGCCGMGNVTGRNNKLLLTNSNLLIQRPVTQYPIFILEMVSLRSKYFRCVSFCYLSWALFIGGVRALIHTRTPADCCHTLNLRCIE
jgi:hypothetical protein